MFFLILNEAITNSIKYAFPNDHTGTTYVTLEATLENRYLPTILDNRIGTKTNYYISKIELV